MMVAVVVVVNVVNVVVMTMLVQGEKGLEDIDMRLKWTIPLVTNLCIYSGTLKLRALQTFKIIPYNCTDQAGYGHHFQNSTI